MNAEQPTSPTSPGPKCWHFLTPARFPTQSASASLPWNKKSAGCEQTSTVSTGVLANSVKGAVHVERAPARPDLSSLPSAWALRT